MEVRDSLLTAARRYAGERAAEREVLYWELPEFQARQALIEVDPLSAGPWDYSPRELDAFPRYLVLWAILDGVEALGAATFDDLDEALEGIVRIGWTADDVMTRNLTGDTELAAVRDERERFERYLRGLDTDDLLAVQPLPFRRTLSPQESASLWSALQSHWGVTRDDYWFPLASLSPALDAEGVKAYSASDLVEGPWLDGLRLALARLGLSRVFELRETPGVDREIELAEFRPVYDFTEGFWTDQTCSWLVYASHEQSVTIAGGQLLQLAREIWSPSGPTSA